MTETRTSYSPTSSSRASKNRCCSTVTFPTIILSNHDVEVGQGSPKKLEAAIEGLVTSAEQAGMSRDGVQSLRQLMTEYEDVFMLKLVADHGECKAPSPQSARRCRSRNNVNS
jgi:hypothetical protein